MNKKIKKILNKKNKSKVICLTAYSKNVATILDKYCDLILVGDSLGSVLYNYKSTKEVTLDIMINHSKSVKQGVKKSLMVVDMPYNTYRNPKEALKNSRLVMKKTKCDAIKLEGGRKLIPIIKTLIKNKIPVMGHLGILPQTEKKFTFKGRQTKEIVNLFKDAKLLEKAGIFSVVLECVEMNVAKRITDQLKIPTIGIGSSVNCDGQVLVIDDLVGLSESKFRFVKKYANLKKVINSAVKSYKSEVLKKKFPKAKHSFKK
tara:strand:- start:483 stop:1262 length:780 start_codon:yes stop_codon:yes gene_type:complete